MKPHGALGRVPDRHESLPDGGVADVPFADVVSAVARILDEEDPHVAMISHPNLVADLVVRADRSTR